jgi:hypothetical protein
MEPVPRKALSLLFCCAFLAARGEALAAGGGLPEKLAMIRLPPGFEISVYAEGVENARQLALGDRGTVFAGSHEAGKVHAVVDRDGDHLAAPI